MNRNILIDSNHQSHFDFVYMICEAPILGEVKPRSAHLSKMYFFFILSHGTKNFFNVLKVQTEGEKLKCAYLVHCLRKWATIYV